MNELQVKDVISKNYNLNIKNIEAIKNIYRVDAEEGRYCIKIIRYQFSHFNFILSAILHLQKNGFRNIPKIIKTKDDKYYIELSGYYAYLTEWIPSRQSDFKNEKELAMVSEELGMLHRCSEGFSLTKDMKPRIGWFSWIDVFTTRRDEILDFKHRIEQKAYKSNFDLLYLSCLDEEVERANKSVTALKKSNYREIMEREVLKRGFCHHDYANHNILLTPSDDIYVIDFDYCIMDTHLHDVASLLIRSMKNGNWDYKIADCIINNYSKIKAIKEEELPILKNFMDFPQIYWQLGIQMYWEQQPWKESVFLNRLGKYIEDREDREKFNKEYFSV